MAKADTWEVHLDQIKKVVCYLLKDLKYILEQYF